MRVFSFCLVVICFSSSYAALPSSFKPNQLRLSLDSEYYWSQRNFTEGGDSIALPSTNGYQNLSNNLGVAYYFDGSWMLETAIAFASARSQSPIEDRSNSELTHFTLKSQTLINWPQFRLIPEALATFEFHQIDPNTDSVMTSEGANSYQVGSWAIFNLSSFKTYGFLGFQYRADGRSALLPWTFGLAWRATKFLTAFEIGGYQSISNDENINQRQIRSTVTSRVNGGSLRYYSVNPSLTELRAQLAYNFSPAFQTALGATYALAGNSTAAGQSAMVSLIYAIDYNSKAKIKRLKGRAGEDSLDNSFEPQLEDYDESIFEN